MIFALSVQKAEVVYWEGRHEMSGKSLPLVILQAVAGGLSGAFPEHKESNGHAVVSGCYVHQCH